jgi:hypothetical protein
VDFRLKVKSTKKDLILPLKLSYKDSMNNNYENRVETSLKFYTAKDLGIEKDNTLLYIGGSILILVIGYYIYRKFSKKKRNYN